MVITSDPLAGASVSEITGVLVWMRYVSVISPVVLIYDWLLTLDDEVCLIFSSLAYFAWLTAWLVLVPRFVLFGRGPSPCQRQSITLIATYPLP